VIDAMMKRYTVAMTEEMEKKLESERKKRLLDSIPETIRVILSEYLSRP
jgi:Arc/MetJ-type ribon-helix-helix transcriptional regulator